MPNACRKIDKRNIGSKLIDGSKSEYLPTCQCRRDMGGSLMIRWPLIECIFVYGVSGGIFVCSSVKLFCLGVKAVISTRL